MHGNLLSRRNNYQPFQTQQNQSRNNYNYNYNFRRTNENVNVLPNIAKLNVNEHVLPPPPRGNVNVVRNAIFEKSLSQIRNEVPIDNKIAAPTDGKVSLLSDQNVQQRERQDSSNESHKYNKNENVSLVAVDSSIQICKDAPNDNENAGSTDDKVSNLSETQEYNKSESGSLVDDESSTQICNDAPIDNEFTAPTAEKVGDHNENVQQSKRQEFNNDSHKYNKSEGASLVADDSSSSDNDIVPIDEDLNEYLQIVMLDCNMDDIELNALPENTWHKENILNLKFSVTVADAHSPFKIWIHLDSSFDTLDLITDELA